MLCGGWLSNCNCVWITVVTFTTLTKVPSQGCSVDTEPVERRGCSHEPTMKGDLMRIEGEFADADDPNADGNRGSP